MARKIYIIILSIHAFIFFGAVFTFGIPKVGFDIGTLFLLSSCFLVFYFIILTYFYNKKNYIYIRFINLIYYLSFIHLILHTILLINIAG